MEKYSTEFWYEAVVEGVQSNLIFDQMCEILATEFPRIISVVGERTCNLHCKHCFFRPERSSLKFSEENQVATAVKTLVNQMEDPLVVYEGRIFSPEHLQWLGEIRQIRPDAKVGMIDNGSYIKHLEQIFASGFKFDWVDISIDGQEDVHDFQRNKKDAFRQAIGGIENAKVILNSGGKINTLFTLTNINSASLVETAKIIPQEVDEWHVTTITATRPELTWLSVDEGEFKEILGNLRKANEIKNLNIRVYDLVDLIKLARTVGRKAFFTALERAYADYASISFSIDGIQFVYYPLSMSINECLLVDADAYCRMPYALMFTLEELSRGVANSGEDIGKYTVGKVDGNTNFRDLYKKVVQQWRVNFFKEAIKSEVDAFRQIKTF